MRNTLLFTILLISNLCFSQNKLKNKPEQEQELFKEAYKHIRQKKYKEARQELEEILHKIDSTEFDANYDLGYIYHKRLNDPGHALKYFERADRSSDPVDEKDFHYLIAECYQYAEDYDKAEEYILKYKKFNKREEYIEDVDDKLKSIRWAKEHTNYKNNWIRVINLGEKINNELAEYTPVFDQYDSILMFTTRHADNTGGKKDHWDNLFYEDMYFTHGYKEKMQPAHKFDLSEKYVSHVKNTEFHDAIVSISPKRTKLFTFHNNKLYQSTIKDHKELVEPEKLSKNVNIGRYQNHASVTSDDKTLYFTSSKKSKSKGGIDIFMSEKGIDGKWGKAQNLGEVINTEYDEESPLISPDGSMLFFGSKGHQGFGGYDMFVSYKNSNGEWSKPENLGSPINSGGDDLYPFLMDTSIYSHGYGYISSSRKGGYGQMDIYFMEYFARPEFKRCGKKIQLIHSKNEVDSANYVGFYTLEDTISINKPAIFDASVSNMGGHIVDKHWWLFGDSSETYYEREQTIHTYRKPGIYNIFLEVEAYPLDNEEGKIRRCVQRKIVVLDTFSYNQFVAKRAYRDSIKQSNELLENYENITQVNGNKNLSATEKNNLNGDSLEIAKTNSEGSFKDPKKIFEGIKVKPIYFDFDKFNIREDAQLTMKENIDILKANPSIKITITAHTDSRGTNDYNFKLSENRANSCLQWLVKNGIDSERIMKVLFEGETKLINDCTDAVDCGEDLHQQNRRADFTIISE